MLDFLDDTIERMNQNEKALNNLRKELKDLSITHPICTSAEGDTPC